MRMTAVDRISTPSFPDRVNDDAFACIERGAIVVDGATGLAETPLLPDEEGDAAWLARLAARRFAEEAARGRATADIIASINAEIADALAAAGVDAAATPAWALPTGGFQSLRVLGDDLETAGLGDCTLLLRDADGVIQRHTGQEALRDHEQTAARAAIAEIGGLDGAAGALRAPEVLRRLRADRAKRNKPGGLWTLGGPPEAAEQLRLARLSFRPPAMALLATDGFMDLTDLYGVVDEAALIDRSAKEGLAPLVAELRRYETEIDPRGETYPRFKQTDDSTALLLRIEA